MVWLGKGAMRAYLAETKNADKRYTRKRISKMRIAGFWLFVFGNAMFSGKYKH